MDTQNTNRLLIPDIEEMIEKGEWDSLLEFITQRHYGDIAEILEDLDPAMVADVIRRLPYPVNVEVFSHLEETHQVDVIDQIGRGDLVKLIEQMPPDDRAGLLRQLPEAAVDAILPSVAQVERNDIRRLLEYEEDTAGSIMTTEYATLSPDLTVAEALQKLRQVAPERETIYIVYVVGPYHRLQGVVSLRDLVVARPNLKISDIMVTNVISMNVNADQEEVAEAMKKYDFIAIPIVDAQNRLVGIVTYDDIVDILEEEYTEDAQRQGAMEPLDVPYLATSIGGMVRRRVIWIAILFFGEMFTGTALRHYEDSLKQVIVLMIFLPIIIASGGHSGAQSVALITRALGVGDISVSDWLRITFRESATGILMGLILGVIGFIRAIAWDFTPLQASCVALTLIGVVTMGTLLGSLLPLFFQKVGLDPAITSQPFVASIVDVLGIVIYFNVAIFLLGL